jgi:hypothetical protein
MSELQVRIPSDVLNNLRKALSQAVMGREPVVFGLASHADTDWVRLVLVREIVAPPEIAFLPSAGHGARWKGAYMIELLNRALAEKLGLFIFHSHGRFDPAHGSSDTVGMSLDDLQSASALLPKFQSVAPNRPHGSIVVGDRSAAGHVLMPGSRAFTESFSTRFFTNTMITSPRPGTKDELLLLDRQPIAANPIVTRILGDTTVAVVGLSGGGSQVVPQLAALGIGTIIGIDDQRVERSNLYATSRLGWLDMALGRKKTSVGKTGAWWVNTRSRFIGVDARVPKPAALDAVKAADIVVGCVNNLHARADLMELCWRYCIPYVDIGFAATVKQRWEKPGPPPLTGLPGNVFVGVPGGACMWCTEFLTKEKLDAVTEGRGRSYLRDQKDQDAYVLSFNGLLASQAVSEVLQLLVGYATSDSQRTYRRFDGMSGSMLECTVRRKAGCDLCNSVLAAGDPVWS